MPPSPSQNNCGMNLFICVLIVGPRVLYMIQICLDSVLICLDRGKFLCRDKLVGVLLCAETSEDPDLEPDMYIIETLN
jgi:hypothetical protein